jgi:hypothetical protein
VLYEINEDGKPIAIVNAPRMIDGARFKRVPNGVVWGGQDTSFTALAASVNRQPAHSSPGSPNLLLRLDWFRQVALVEPDAWLRTDRATSAVAFGDEEVFCTPSGGYVVDEKKRIFSFPLAAINVRTGVERAGVLEVPFEGNLRLPSTNVGTYTSKGGRETHKTWGTYALGLTYLQLRGKVLELTLGMEQWTARLDFDLAALQAPGD